MNGKIVISIDDNGVGCETEGIDVFQTLFFLEIAKKIIIDEGFANAPEEG